MKKLTVVLLLVCFATPLFGGKTRRGRTVPLSKIAAELDKQEAARAQSPMGVVAIAKQALAQKGFHLTGPVNAAAAKATETDPDPAEPTEVAPAAPAPEEITVQSEPAPADEAQEAVQAEEAAAVQGCEPNPAPKEYAGFSSDSDNEQLPAQDKHSTYWYFMHQPLTFNGLTQLLNARETIDSKYKDEFRNFVKDVVIQLTNELEENQKKNASESDVNQKRTLCKIASEKTEALMTLISLAKAKGLKLPKNIKHRAYSLIQNNLQSIEGCRQVEAEERAQFRASQPSKKVTETFGISTLEGRLARLMVIKKESFNPQSKKRAQIKSTIEQMALEYAELIETQLVNPEDVLSFLNQIKERGITPDRNIMTRLLEAINTNQSKTNEQAEASIRSHIDYNNQIKEIEAVAEHMTTGHYAPTESLVLPSSSSDPYVFMDERPLLEQLQLRISAFQTPSFE